MASAVRHYGSRVAEKKSLIGEIDEQWFAKYDRDGDGRISEKELRAAISERGGLWVRLFSRWYANRCMTAADKNCDGYIRGDELNSLIEFTRNQLP